MAVTPTLAPAQVQPVSAPEAPAPALPDPDWNWWHLPRRGDTDPDTARQARTLRIRWRLEHPAAWQAEIESLSHYQPEYPYDEGYEYDEDFTTDPNYGSDAAVLTYDPEGFVTAEPPLHGFGRTMCQIDLEQHLQTLGWALHQEPHVYFPAAAGRRLGLRTPGGKDQQVVKPDLAVVPADSPAFNSGNLWLGRDDPAPLLIIEFLWPTSTRRDREDKQRLYAYFGVREYAVCDLGAAPHKLESVRTPGLDLYRLRDDGAYAHVPAHVDAETPVPGTAAASAVLGVPLRLYPTAPGSRPRLQWRDPVQDRWRDHDADHEHRLRETRVRSYAEGHAKGHAEGRAEARLELTLQVLDRVLPADADRAGLARHWTAHGVPDNVVELIFAVRAEPDRWRELLDMPPPLGSPAATAAPIQT